MKQTINFNQFVDAFHRMDRADQFSRDGLRILFDYIEDLEDNTGEELELDVIGLCCDFSELYDAELADEYNIEEKGGETLRETVVAFLEDAGCYVGSTEDGMIVFRTL